MENNESVSNFYCTIVIYRRKEFYRPIFKPAFPKDRFAMGFITANGTVIHVEIDAIPTKLPRISCSTASSDFWEYKPNGDPSFREFVNR